VGKAIDLMEVPPMPNINQNRLERTCVAAHALLRTPRAGGGMLNRNLALAQRRFLQRVGSRDEAHARLNWPRFCPATRAVGHEATVVHGQTKTGNASSGQRDRWSAPVTAMIAVGDRRRPSDKVARRRPHSRRNMERFA